MIDLKEFAICEDMLSANERDLRQQVRDWTSKEIMPIVGDFYERGDFPPALGSKLGAQGWLGMTVPAKDGGGGRTYREYGIVCQEMERADSGLRSLISVHSSLAMHAIYAFGNDAQKQKYLPQLFTGAKIGCFSLTEPAAGSDPSAMTTRASKTATGWKLNGSKRWISALPIADVVIVWAMSDDGMLGFVVDTLEAKAQGLTIRPIHHKLSLRMSPSAEMILEDCELPDDALLAKTDIGLRAPLSCLTQARFGICWGAIGAAAHCYELAKNYCGERTQFGRSLTSFQLVQDKLADACTDIIHAQLFNLRLAELFDNGDMKPAFVSVGKRNACRVARRVARNCRDLLGGNGILSEHHIMRHLCNVETIYSYEGTDHIHTLAIGQYITGENAFR